jgi:Phosphoesterase family
MFVRLLLVCGLFAALSSTPAVASTPGSVGVPRYDHLFVIVEENHGFTDVIGNPAAPNLNALAEQFGLATKYFGVTHPSEPNYVALLGGNFFGVADDNPYWMNSLTKPNLMTQLDGAGVSWKAYLQALPYPGYQGICYPSKCNGSPDIDPLYVSKHDAIQNYTTSRSPRDWSRQVPIEQLTDDLKRGDVPTFSYVIPDECHDQHGDPPYCLDSGEPFDAQDQHLVAFGDEYLGGLVATITGADFWSKGNNAVVIVYDEGDDDAGCCDATPGGGQIAAVVVTNHGPRGVKDATAYDHYSLLRTIQQSLGLGCLEFTCDTANVKTLAPLFAVTGSAAVRTAQLPVPEVGTPSPTADEPVSFTTNTDQSAGWRLVPAPVRGTNDNSLGAIAAAGDNDLWAVGNFVPDTPSSNQDATLSLAMHFDGSHWSSTPTPNAGPNFNTLFGAAAAGRQAWGVGVHLNQAFQTSALIESWHPETSQWRIDRVPQPGAERDLLFAASAASANDVWAVGEQQSNDGRFGTLVEHWDGLRWRVVPAPDPGASGNHLYGVVAAGRNDVWAVGQRNDAAAPDHELILHWDGSDWSVVPTPRHATASADLFAVTPDGRGGLWTVGETLDPDAGGKPLLEHIDARPARVETVDLPSTGSRWTTLWGVAATDHVVSAVGTFFDATAGFDHTLVMSGSDNQHFHVVAAPSPGGDDAILSGAIAVGDTVWAVGLFRPVDPRAPLIMTHLEGR